MKEKADKKTDKTTQEAAGWLSIQFQLRSWSQGGKIKPSMPLLGMETA